MTIILGTPVKLIEVKIDYLIKKNQVKKGNLMRHDCWCQDIRVCLELQNYLAVPTRSALGFIEKGPKKNKYSVLWQGNQNWKICCWSDKCQFLL